MGTLEKISTAWIKSWKFGACKHGLSNLDRIRMHKYLYSCSPIYYRIGDYGKVKKITGLTVLGKIALYTFKVTITLKKSLFI